MSKIKFLIATHKKYNFPISDCYLPIQVGKENSSLELGIQTDNDGENISNKNKTFCELTALYWAWKSPKLTELDYIGLVHYRRYFQGKGEQLKGKKIASEQELVSLLSTYDVIAPKKRNYYIETVYNHYKNAHYIKDLELVKQIIIAKYPDYLTAFEQVMQGKKLHLFNMFVLKKSLFDDYCQWLFDILFESENKMDISGYDDYQKRVFGFLAERLFNVFLLKHQLRIKEVKVVSLEGENLLKKAIGLLKRKFLK